MTQQAGVPGRGGPDGDRVERRGVLVRGTVQGVGFRPFVVRLARRHGLAGLVRNTSNGVAIEVEGPAPDLERFIAAVGSEAPPLARVGSVAVSPLTPRGDRAFVIEESSAGAGWQGVPPDAATCDACLAELLDPADRRHRYPFLNCTDCGPRYTIIESLPYDRPRTTMRRFVMCPACQAEYDDPGNRRYHAQPNACPVCGPRLRAVDSQGVPVIGDPVAIAAAALADRRIVAVKALGGYQLACDAGSNAAVRRLRQRKRRVAKPFAVMVRDLEAARAIAEVDALEAAMLVSPARPVVLLGTGGRAGGAVSDLVAPGLDRLGVMLPSTPLHHLLLEGGRVLVMTSGNVSDEPIARDDGDAFARLGPIADLFLCHDREIHARYDDSVAVAIGGEGRVVRRARGLCPAPLTVAGLDRDTVAFGGHLKHTFAVSRGDQVLVGPHIGDLASPLSLDHHAEALSDFHRLFGVVPSVVACDLHPDYASTRLAEELSRTLAGPAGEAVVPVRVQHHHAHVASVMAEHGLRGPIIGVALDGTGYGTDGTIWGGEFLVCDEAEFVRAGHLATVRQPGGERCAVEGWRMAAAYLVAAGIDPGEMLEWLDPLGAEVGEQNWRVVCRLAASEMAPLSSSAGRLFDAVSSLLGVAQVSSFEAEAAMRLEALARSVPAARADGWDLPVSSADGLVVDTLELVRRVVADRRGGRPVAEIAAAFHESLARAVLAVCTRIRDEQGPERVALSGGVFQNALLLERTLALLGEHGFAAFANRQVPANDGGISLGQLLVAGSRAGGPR